MGGTQRGASRRAGLRDAGVGEPAQHRHQESYRHRRQKKAPAHVRDAGEASDEDPQDHGLRHQGEQGDRAGVGVLESPA